MEKTYMRPNGKRRFIINMMLVVLGIFGMRGYSFSQTVASDYFRSNVVSGPWSSPGNWQSSNNNLTWITATLAPTSAANTITITKGNTVTVTNSITLDQTNIDGTLEVQTGGVLNITDGLGDDITINPGGILRFITISNYGTAVKYTPITAKIHTLTGGKITLGNGAGSVGSFYELITTDNIWDDGAIYEWNNAGAFDPTGVIYFPAAAITKPIFRVTACGSLPNGGSLPTSINGIFEVNTNLTFNGPSSKYFRDGIRGTATLTQATQGGNSFNITGINAVLDGASLKIVLSSPLNLQASVNVPLGANVTISGDNINNAFSGNVFTINGTLDITSILINNTNSNTSSIIVNGTIRTAYTGTGGLYGLNGAIPYSTLTLNTNSTVEYYADAIQYITTTDATALNQPYYNLFLSGSNNKIAPSTTVEIKGNLTGAGTAVFVHSKGTFFMNGTAGQAYTATTEFGFYNLTNNSTLAGGGLSVNSNLSVFKELKLNTLSSLNLNTGDIRLKSSDTLTANVALIPAGELNIVQYTTGRFSIERYLQAYKSWRLLATPIEIATSPSISGSWRESNSTLTSTGYGTQITGPAGPSFPSNSGEFDVKTQRGSLKSYNATADSYDEVLINTSTTKIANLTGYFVFVRGDRGVGITGLAGITNLRMRGKLRIGDQPFIVPPNKFQSFGNPYASRVDFRTIYNSSIAPSYYVWNPNPAGTFYGAGKYETYVNFGDGNYRLGNSLGPIKNYIESGQAVFIQSITGGTIYVKESDKLSGSSLVSRGAQTSRTRVIVPTLEINLFVKNANADTVLADAAVINFDDNFSNTVDNMDVRKVINTSDNLSTFVSNNNLVLNRRKPLNAFDTIFLRLTNTRVGSYRFNIDPFLLNNLGLQASMNDKFLQTEIPVSLSQKTDMSFDITNDPRSRLPDRFMIVFKQNLPVRFTAITALRNNDQSINITWNTENENNINNYKIEKSLDGVNFTEIASQMPTANNFGNPYYTIKDEAASKEITYYRIKANDIAGNLIYSNTAIVLALKEENNKSINIYPNPVTNGNININFEGSLLSNYVISINNFAGQLIRSEAFKHRNIGETFSIKISNVVAGLYTATIVDETGSKKLIPFIIK